MINKINTFFNDFFSQNIKEIKETPTKLIIRTIIENNMTDFICLFNRRDYMKGETLNAIVKYERIEILKKYLTGQDNMCSFLVMTEQELISLKDSVKLVLLNDSKFMKYISINEIYAYKNFNELSLKNKIDEF
jgi:hypothetical protein